MLNPNKNFITVIFLITAIYASGQFKKFELVLNEPGVDNPRRVIQTLDSGYVVCGTSNSYNSFGNMDPVLIKFNSAGEYQWKRTYESAAIENIKSILLLPDNGYLLSGFSNEVNNNYSPIVIRTDMQGNLVWDTIYSGNNWEFVNTSTLLSDGSIVFSGLTYRVTSGGPDAFAMRIDSVGNVIWKKIFNGINYDEINEISNCTNGDLILCGNTNSIGTGGSDILLIRINSNGDSLWSKTFGQTGDDFGHSVFETSDSTIVFAGSLQSSDSVHQYYAAKTDASGNLIWEMIDTRVEDEAYLTIRETADGNFAASGYTGNLTGGNEDFYLFKMDPNGGFIWARTYGSLETEICYDMIITSDQGFALLGETFSYGTNAPNLYLIKTDTFGISTGNILFGIEEGNFSFGGIQLYPNPANESTTIFAKSNSSSEKYKSINIYSLDSKLIRRIELSENFKSIDIPLNEILPGVYLVSLESSKQNYIQRLCIQR